MISTNTKMTAVFVALISVLAFASLLSDSSNAEDSGTVYSFYLCNTVDGEDSTINGWYSATGTTVVNAFVNALDTAHISYTGFTAEDEKISFSSDKKISDWTKGAWATDGDKYGNNYAIWNYNAEDGWHLGNTLGLACGTYQSHKSTSADTAFIISHEAYLDTKGKTAESLGFSMNSEGKCLAPSGLWTGNAAYGYLQLSPRDLSAAPAEMMFGVDKASITTYNLIINSSVPDKDQSFNGNYTAYGTGAVQAFAQILNKNNVPFAFDASASSVYFKSGDISDWTTKWDTTAEDIVGANIAIWNYDSEKGWFTGNTFGTDPETTYLISYENYYSSFGDTAYTLGVTYDEDFNFNAPAGIGLGYAAYGAIQKAPVDLKATPDKLVFGPVDIKEYTIYLYNTVDGEDSSFNGKYTGYGNTPVQALVQILNSEEIEHTLKYSAEYVSFTTGSISDWTTDWDASSEELIGPNFAIWNYNEEKGWFTGNYFGKDPETTYYISHENYYSWMGETAFINGVFYDEDFNFYAPAGILVNQYGWYQMCPRDLSAAPENVKFGPAEIVEYNIYLCNFVDGQDSEINGWYPGYGNTPVQALKQILTYMEIENKIDYSAESVYFKTDFISDWTASWDSSADDNLGANYAVWNYDSKKGWFTGNTFGMDPETTYMIIHENYYVPSGKTAASLGVVVTESGISVPVGLVDGWGMYVHYAPIDLKAEPENVIIGKVVGIDFLASIEVDGKISYYATLAEANAATIGTAFKVVGNVTLPATLSLKKDMEVINGVTVTVAKALTVAKDKTLTIDEGAKVVLSGANISNSGTIVIKGVLETTRNNVNGTTGTITGNVTVNPYYAVDDTGTFTAGAGTTVHNASSDSAKYSGSTKVTLTYTVTAIPGEGSGSWDNCGTVTITGIDFQDDATIAYIPSYIISKVTIGSGAVYCYYKVSALSDDVVSAINGKTIRVFLPAAIQGQKFSETVTSDNLTYYTDADGNTVYYHVDETTPAWMNGYTTYTMYTKAENPDARYCEQGTIYAVKLAEGQSTYGKKTVKWATNDAVSSDEYVSGAWADMTASVMVADKVKTYTFILSNTVEGEDSTVNGTYTALADTPVRALSMALNAAGIANKIDPNAASVWFGAGSISDWSSAWDSSAEDLIGANYAVWNYDSVKGWFTGNTFGTDPETTYYISHENYYAPTGPTALSLGVSSGADGVYCAPSGIVVSWGMYVQVAPRDYKATPEDVVFGVDSEALKTYTFVLKNSIPGENSEINGTYTGIGTNAVQAIVYALNINEIAHKIDYTASSVWFSAGTIADWSSAWDSSATECYGANYAVWNYDSVKGWFIGNTFGTDPETTYLISHENYYVASGKIAKAMGIDGETVPAGLVVSWGMYVQTAPMDMKATVENLVFNPYYVITLDVDGTLGYIAQIEGSAVVAPTSPAKEGYDFIKWDPEIPATMPADNITVVAVWGVSPVITGDEVDVDLSDGDSFIMPDVSGKKVVVDMGDAEVVIPDSAALAGKVITSKVDPIVNPTQKEGTAYEFTFQADGAAYSGPIQVTLPFSSKYGCSAAVYFVDGGNLVEMKIVSSTSDTVTFETTHNSTYLVSYVESEGPSDLAKIGSVAVAIAVIVAAIVAVAYSRRKTA